MTTTFTKHPKCEKHKLLRTLSNGAVVVSSAALHAHLGGRYQEFIATVAKYSPKPLIGFHPEGVEKFLSC